MSVLAGTTDPDGRTVVLDNEGWEHILHEHPELAPYRLEIMAAVNSRITGVQIPVQDESATTAKTSASAAGCSWSYNSTRHRRGS